MEYSARQIRMIVQKIIAKVQHELELAQMNDSVDEVMEKYGISLDESPVQVSPRLSKILVLGSLAGKKRDYILAAKKMNIPSDNIEFEDDYEKLTNFNTAKLRNSLVYSDIICGPMPHSMENKEGASLIAEIRSNPASYPKMVTAEANSSLKLSINSFKNALTKTRYFEALGC